MTYDIENPDLGTGQAQQCGGVKPVYGYPTDNTLFLMCLWGKAKLQIKYWYGAEYY